MDGIITIAGAFLALVFDKTIYTSVGESTHFPIRCVFVDGRVNTRRWLRLIEDRKKPSCSTTSWIN